MTERSAAPGEMMAAVYRKKGPAREVFSVERVAVPPLGTGDVCVRVAASGVNPSDVKNRAGTYTAEMAYPFVIPHSDGAGVIEAVGSSVAPNRVGERVWLYNAQWQRPFGTAAQYCVLPADQAVRLPAAASFAVGACLAIPALTAHRAVHLDEPIAGETVLVAGGAGAVGQYAIQFAKLAGARVISTVSSTAKAAVATAAGADACINYRSDDVVARVRDLTQGRGLDRVIELDIAANGHLYPQILRIGGVAVVYGSGTPDATLPVMNFVRADLTLRFFLMYQLSQAVRNAAIADITALLERGALIHHIAQRFPLERIAEAHEAVEAAPPGGGNIVIDVMNT